MVRVKEFLGIISLLSIMIIPSFIQYQNLYNQGTDEYFKNLDSFLQPAGFFNLTGSKIFIDDMNSSYNWEETAKNDWCTGEGNIDDPYLIQDVILDENGSDTCVEIRNSRVYFIIENCLFSNAEIGIKIENCTNFKVIKNRISVLQGKDGLSSSESSLGIDGENGNESMGILINDCVNFDLYSNEISNIMGGDGEDGITTGTYGTNGGNGGSAYGILVNDSKNLNIKFSIISNVIGGKGGDGGNATTNGVNGGLGGNGGRSNGINVKNSINVRTQMNIISDIIGGKGGNGGLAGITSGYNIAGFCGNGGMGGNCIGICLEQSTILNSQLNNIRSIYGGNGGNGGSGLFRDNVINIYGIEIRIPINPGVGGNGGNGGFSYGVCSIDSINVENNNNHLISIFGGIGGNGGKGGIESIPLPGSYNIHVYGGAGGNGGNGGLSSGIYFKNSFNIINHYNYLQEIFGGSGSNAGRGCYEYPTFPSYPPPFNIVCHGGDGGNGGNGGLSYGFLFENSINSTNKVNKISIINGGENGTGGSKGIGDINGTHGYPGVKGIGHGFSLLNTNDSLSYLNAIYCENNIDNGTNNRWNNAFHGNYWSFYSGVDLDGDGIGDEPYLLGGSAQSKDYLPLMEDPFLSPPLSPNQLLYLIIWIIIGATMIGSAVVISGIVISRRKRTRRRGYWLPKLREE